MLSPELEESLRSARLALDAAISDNIIELCKQYLSLLALSRAELYRLPGILELDNRSATTSTDVKVGDVRRAVRTAIEETTRERNRIETLLHSFTALSGYEAAEILNSEKHKGHTTWELRAGVVGVSDNALARMSVREAVDTASLLRREAWIKSTSTIASAKIAIVQDSEPDLTGEGSIDDSL